MNIRTKETSNAENPGWVEVEFYLDEGTPDEEFVGVLQMTESHWEELKTLLNIS